MEDKRESKIENKPHTPKDHAEINSIDGEGDELNRGTSSPMDNGSRDGHTHAQGSDSSPIDSGEKHFSSNNVEKNRDGELRRSLQASSIGIVLVVSIVIGILMGTWLDKKFDTKPIMTIIFLIIGILSGVKSAYMFLKQAGIFDKNFGRHLSTGERELSMSPYKIFRRGYKQASSNAEGEEPKEKIVTHPTVEQNLNRGWEDKAKEDVEWAQLYISEEELDKEIEKEKNK